VACPGRLPSRQLKNQVGQGAGKCGREMCGGWFEVNFETGFGFNLGAQRCPDLGLPMFLCWS